MKNQSELAEIRSLIEQQRSEFGITELGRTRQMETSGIARGIDGDIQCLIDQQLVCTDFGYGAWSELDNPEIRAKTLKILKNRHKE